MSNLDPVEDKLADCAKRDKAADDAIAKHEREIAKLRHVKELISVERKTWTTARELLNRAVESAPLPDASQMVHVHSNAPRGGEKATWIASPWDAILRSAHEHAPRGEFTYDLVIECGRDIEKEIKKPSCRTQILGYKTRGFVEAVRPGVFRLTPKGLAAIGLNDEGPVEAGPSGISKGLAGSPGEHSSQVLPDGSIPSSSTSASRNGSYLRTAIPQERPPATESSHVKTY